MRGLCKLRDVNLQISRKDIPAIAEGINGVKGPQVPDAIHLYSKQLSESIKKSDYRRMVTAGNVLVALMRRQVDILSQRVDSRE